MSNIVLFDHNQSQQLPAYLQTGSVNVNADLLATIGAGGNRIGLKGNRFRLVVNGKEERVFDENYLDVIVVGVVPHISRMYYEKEFKEGEKAAPTCYSADGKAPPIDLEGRKSNACDNCPMNEKGSKIVNGVKMKACGFFQRIVVMIAGDDSGTYYKLDVKSQGLFGDSKPQVNKYNLREYAKMLSNRGADIAKLATRLSFDTDSSVPKLLFQANRFVTEQEYAQVVTAVGSAEVTKMLEISMATIDLSNEVAEDTAPATPVEPVTPAGTQTAIQQPVQEEAPKPVAPKAEVPPQKRQYKMVPEVAGEWTYNQLVESGWTLESLLENGYMIDVTPEPPKPAAPPAPPKPAAPPAPPKPPTPPAPKAAAIPVPPKANSAPAPKAAPQEVSSDKELNDLIGSLNLT